MRGDSHRLCSTAHREKNHSDRCRQNAVEDWLGLRGIQAAKSSLASAAATAKRTQSRTAGLSSFRLDRNQQLAHMDHCVRLEISWTFFPIDPTASACSPESRLRRLCSAMANLWYSTSTNGFMSFFRTAKYLPHSEHPYESQCAKWSTRNSSWSERSAPRQAGRRLAQNELFPNG